MKTQGSHWGARGAIVAVGVLGVLFAARTAAFYLDVDRLAFGLSLVIAAGLTVGIVELLGRVSRAAPSIALRERVAGTPALARSRAMRSAVTSGAPV